MPERVFIQVGDKRTAVRNFHTVLHTAFDRGQIVHPEPEDKYHSPWIGYGYAKGVTHHKRPISVLGLPTEMKRGLHGKLIQGFPNVDDRVRCYEPDAEKGFGGFIRWAYFIDPNDPHCAQGVFGVDYSPGGNMFRGIANNFSTVARVVRTAGAHGIPNGAAVVLLDPHLCEPPAFTQWRENQNLVSVSDWIRYAIALSR